MRIILSLFALLAFPWLGLGDGPPSKDLVQDELKALQGTWVVDVEIYKTQQRDRPSLTEVTIKDDTITFKKRSGNATTWAFRIDPSKKPKELDVIRRNKVDFFKAIYDVDGDTLKLCYSGIDGDPRPTEFASPWDAEHTYRKLKRAKPKE